MNATTFHLVRRQTLRRGLVAAWTLCGFALGALANPTGLTVQSGAAALSLNGSQLTVTAGNNAILNWRSFNVATGERTVFNQPSATSVVWNRINGQSPSQIYGSLQANGIVVLLNSSGFYFGPNSYVSAAGLVVSTANCQPPQNAGGSWVFNGPPPLAGIVNFGTIKVGQGGSAYLIADKVENHGDIEAPGGGIGLAAGQTVTLSERPDGRGMSMNVVLPQGSVNNYGNLIADGGTIALNAKVVNQNGLVQANSVREQNGVIELVASDAVKLGANSQILAQGDDAAAGSAGGAVTIRSGNIFSDETGGVIKTTGGGNGGNGGNVEISAPNVESLNSAMDARAATGWLGGEFLLDPVNIILGTTGAGVPNGSGTVAYNSGASTLTINVNTAFKNKNFSNIKLQATGNITLNANTTWDLSTSTGQTTGTLTMQAGGNVIFGVNSLLSDGNNWSVNLVAGYDFSSQAVVSGNGNVYLNGGAGKTYNGAIRLARGSVNLSAGNDVIVGGGYVRTTAGGGITVDALAGSVNTGTLGYGYDFHSSTTLSGLMYEVDPNLGGISTAAGGDVTITAGLNVTSLLPSSSKPAGDAGCGAFGTASGNVTITAGGNVVGHYVVANGTGTITAGANAGTVSTPLALSLVAGGWNVNAEDVVLQEVRNPNGVLNNYGFSTSVSKHYFNYAASDYLNLVAGNSVEFTGSNLPRNSGTFDKGIPVILPGILNLTAGAGGVTLDSDLTLFPSALGSLKVTTTDGGGLISGASGNLVQLVMSDSGASQYTASGVFGYSAHATVPVHLYHPTAVTLNVSGDMNDILLAVPEAATVNVGGNMNDSRFIGQNLHSTDVTGINVTGNILNRSEFTSVSLATAPDLALLAQAYPASSIYASLLSQLHYDSTTKTLTFQGLMTSDQLTALTSLTIQVANANGVPEVDASGNPITATVSILDSATANALYAATQDVNTSPGTGYLIGGGGTFNVKAHNLDLGTTLGIQSVGPQNNPELANYFTHGADLNVTLTGNLDMFSTTISSYNGGNIGVSAAGYANVGSSTFTGSDQVARGIFSVQNSDVSVVVGGDVNINGSRIAAYDGGNVTVESLTGNIDAGTGGRGAVTVQEVYVDPVTREILTAPAIIPGSGILTTTFPQPSTGSSFPASENTVGDILVETPRGNVLASLGGIVQLPLNGVNSPDAVVEVLAGYELRDGSGQRLTAANLSGGTPVSVTSGCNIDASGSGVIGSTVKLDATGDILGVIFARNNIDIVAQQNVNVVALAQGSVNASAGGSISGTLIGIGGVSASGSSIDASLMSQNVSTSGDSSGAKEGFSQGTAANATSQSMSTENSAKVAKTGGDGEDDPFKKKKGIALAQKVSRVTVILPPKKLSGKTTANNSL